MWGLGHLAISRDLPLHREHVTRNHVLVQSESNPGGMIPHFTDRTVPHLPAGIAYGIRDVLHPESLAKRIRDQQTDQEQQRYQAEPLQTEPEAEHKDGS